MNEMSKFQRSWCLVKSSVSVLITHKKLLAFPIVIFTLTALIALFFLTPIVLRPTGHGYTQTEHWKAIGQSLFTEKPAGIHGGSGTRLGLKPVGMAYAACLYLLSMFCATFFNVAFYHEILAALGGTSVSIGRGLRFAGTRLKAILMWTLFAGLVGLIIKTLEQKLDFVGRLIVRFIGIAWSVAAIFTIPVIVMEEETANPVRVLRKSAAILRRTWGETLIGYAGLKFGDTLILIASVVILGGATFVSLSLDNYWIIALTGVGWLLALFAFAYVMSVASQIYLGALYLYASQGIIARPYNKELLDLAWKRKKA